MALPINSAKVWINAFIPRDVLGYTLRVPAGPHVGKTMIPGPQSLEVPTIEGFSPMGRFVRPRMGRTRVGTSDCYLTDQRTFSNEIHAKSRMHSEATITLSSSPPTMTEWHNCDYTTECDCEDGDEECHKKGQTSRMHFRGLRRSGDIVTLEVECAACNPCAPTSRLFGDIDYNGTFTINLTTRSIVFAGRIDSFPAFEAYGTFNDGAGVKIFNIPPPPGNTVMNLPRGATTPVTGSCVIP